MFRLTIVSRAVKALIILTQCVNFFNALINALIVTALLWVDIVVVIIVTCYTCLQKWSTVRSVERRCDEHCSNNDACF